ncbi:ribonuclease HII [Candidatus Margulisiibacteriota bacterium]
MIYIYGAKAERRVLMDPESKLKKNGTKNIAGVDESGRGPLAGPVVAAAVILKDGIRIKGIRDSKMIDPAERRYLYLQIMDNSRSIGVSVVDSHTIDKKNILQASLYAMRHAVELLDVRPKHVLVDGNKEIPEMDLPQNAVISGDKLCRSISAASIIAKVVRDEIMFCYDRVYPNYKFTAHKGYSTKEHIKLLEKYGPTSIHRLSYQPVIDCLRSKGILFL